MVGRHCHRCLPGSLTVRTARRQSRSGRSKPVASEVCAARGRRLDQSLHTTEHPVDIPLTDRSDYYCSWPFVLVDTDVIAESHLPGRCYLQARQRTILGSILATLVSAAESYVGEDQSRSMSWLYDGVQISRLWLHISPLTTMAIIARRWKLCNSPFAVVIRDMTDMLSIDHEVACPVLFSLKNVSMSASPPSCYARIITDPDDEQRSTQPGLRVGMCTRPHLGRQTSHTHILTTNEYTTYTIN